ncbi:MAG: TetR/AcrR family transcriptional regulator, partial [Prolixibacteraceae bacterium]|nr:TetR/AcrR family transcriptional regulator [Prolixibacteraceae bacterium]
KQTMSEKIKDKIIKVAQETFKKYGYRKTTMDEIAFAASKGKSSLYYYFSSKEEVFKEVIEFEANTLKKRIEEAISYENESKLQLKNYFISRMEGFRNLSNFYLAIKDDFLSNLEFIEEIREKYDKDEFIMVCSILKNGIEQKKFKPVDIEITAKALTMIMKGLEIPLFITKEIKDVGQHIDELLDILFYGISI